MSFTAEQIKNLALMELNHEMISDWTDTSNTDIPIIDTQYILAKPVALSMYQWSWAFKYADAPVYEYIFNMPLDRKANTAITLYTDDTMATQVEDYVNNNDIIYAGLNSLYIEYVDTTDAQAFTTLTAKPVKSVVGKYKKATLLPEDFIAYLASFTDENMHVLADYMNVGTSIYTNADKLYIKYIADVDESVFTPEFVDWFKVFLAQRLNGYLNGDMQRQQLLTSEEPFFFRKAKNIDSKRNKHDSLDGNPILWVRGKLGGGAV